MTEDWRRINLANWESRVPVHTGPDGYDLVGYDDSEYLSPVVRYDLPRLGRLDGLDIVHLQCHIGTDTVSLSRLGARTVTGLDFSPSAVAAGRSLAERALTRGAVESPGDAMAPSPDFDDEFMLAEGRNRLPLTYTMQASKA